MVTIGLRGTLYCNDYSDNKEPLQNPILIIKAPTFTSSATPSRRLETRKASPKPLSALVSEVKSLYLFHMMDSGMLAGS